jgi:hypothetical protein
MIQRPTPHLHRFAGAFADTLGVVLRSLRHLTHAPASLALME